MGKTATKSIQRKVQDNIQRVRERIAQACSRANRDPASVRLVAVTKSVDVEVIRIVLESELVDLGESRVQQLAQRAAMIAETQKRRRMLDGQAYDRPLATQQSASGNAVGDGVSFGRFAAPGGGNQRRSL